MPLPTPNADESRDEFITRCAGNEVVNAEFPDTEQRVAVCGNIYDHPEEYKRAVLSIAVGVMPGASHVAAFKQQKGNTYSWDVEVFAVGTWNGYPFTAEDLDKIVASYEQLHSKGYLDAPLKAGHNNDQPMTDGNPALGWVSKLYRKGEKLLAQFTDVPQVVYDAAKARRYRKVSVELEFDVKHKGTMYPYVLTGVALLGADLPAVNTLADLNAYMGRGSMVASRRACFTALDAEGNLNTPKQEGRHMAEIDDKELQQLREQAAQAATLTTQVANFERQNQEREESERKASVDKARATVNAALDQAVTDMRINPAQRGNFARILRVDDDAAVLTIKPEDIEGLLPEKPAGKPTGAAFSAGAQPGGQQRSDEAEDTDALIDEGVRTVMRESGGKLNYTRAYEKYAQANPEIIARHNSVGQFAS